MINALTVDVEDYFHVAAFANNIAVDSWPGYELRVEQNTLRLLDLFDQHETRATFFTLGWVAEKIPGLVAEIASRGHEVACHGYSHQLIYKQDQQTFYDETRRARDILEDITNIKVSGYRAASYSITRQSLWALDILAELGFEYDSSIVPVHHDLYGIPDMPRSPHVLNSPKGHELIEFPPATLALPGMNLPISGGGYFRLYPYWFSRAALNRVNKHDNLPFIFYLHPWEVDPRQPRMQGSWFSRFRHYNNLDKCYGRLERLLQDFEFATAREVLATQQLNCNYQVSQHPAMKAS
jgi:polysaccharide deacetylase family protein (PEP-CTERM system associated)